MTRAAVGPDIDVIACGDGMHFKFRGRFFLTRKGFRCDGYDSAIRHYSAFAFAGKMRGYQHLCPRCKQIIEGG
jgi:hypothetical protein